VACANVANLTLARAKDREREMAVRAALGASRLRLLRQLLTESALLGLLGAGAGLVLAAFSLPVIVALEPGRLPRMHDVGLDVRVLAYAAIASTLTALLFGAAAAFHVLRRSQASALHDGGRGIVGGRQVLRPLLVVGQLGLSLVLLAGAGLLLRSFSTLLAVDPGYDPRGVLTLRLSLPDMHYRYQDQGPKIAEFYRRLDERLATLPGVVAVGATLAPPLSGAPIRTRPYAVRGLEEAGWGSALAHYTTVTPGWFRAVGARLVAGRFHEDRDDRERPLTVVVDQTLARKAWPRADPIGQAIRVEAFRDGRFQPTWGEVVGVVEPVHLSRLEGVEREQVYLAHAQVPQRTMFPTLRVGGDPRALLPAVQEAIESLEKDLPAFDVRLATDHVAAASALLRFSLAGLLGFAVVAAALATGGVYALLAYLVRSRRREMGIRLALGAHPRDILALVVRQGMTLVFLGVAAGLLGALGSTRALASLLFGVKATDAATLASVATLLLASGLLACLAPALGAARVPPNEALRSE
jgi:putative ABC transport system permease protein